MYYIDVCMYIYIQYIYIVYDVICTYIYTYYTVTNLIDNIIITCHITSHITYNISYIIYHIIYCIYGMNMSCNTIYMTIKYAKWCIYIYIDMFWFNIIYMDIHAYT